MLASLGRPPSLPFRPGHRPPALPRPRRLSGAALPPQLRESRWGVHSRLLGEQGSWQVSGSRWAWISMRLHHFGGKKTTVPEEVLLVCSSLSFHLPSSLFPRLSSPPAPRAEATPEAGAGVCRFRNSDHSLPGVGGGLGGAGCFRMLLRRSGLAYCLAFTPPSFSSLISTPAHLPPPHPPKKRRGERKKKAPAHTLSNSF